jgi:hypothetical protein
MDTAGSSTSATLQSNGKQNVPDGQGPLLQLSAVAHDASNSSILEAQNSCGSFEGDKDSSTGFALEGVFMSTGAWLGIKLVSIEIGAAD